MVLLPYFRTTPRRCGETCTGITEGKAPKWTFDWFLLSQSHSSLRVSSFPLGAYLNMINQYTPGRCIHLYCSRLVELSQVNITLRGTTTVRLSNALQQSPSIESKPQKLPSQKVSRLFSFKRCTDYMQHQVG